MSNPRSTRRLRRVLTTVLVAACIIWPGMLAGPALVVRHDVPNPDAVIALGSHEWERLPALARLAQAAPESLVLLTQPVRATAANCHRCSERPAWLRSRGISADRLVVLPQRVQNTLDEALAVAAFRRTRPIRRLVIVTSPYHARRALAVFTSVLGDHVRVGLLPATDDSPARPARWWMAGYDRAYVSYEWAALAWYALKYRIDPMVPVAGEVVG
jgi:uncharacterized SAM-binding protein YcdF (DUF218 family)